MRRSTLLLAALALPALACLPLALAAAPDASAQEPAAGAAPPEESRLHALMEDLNGAVRGLRAAIGVEDLAPAIAEVCRLQRLALDAKDELPGFVAAIDDAEQRAAEAVAYRLQMQDLVRGLLDLEAALAQGDREAADARLKALNAVKKAGHDRFKRDW